MIPMHAIISKYNVKGKIVQTQQNVWKSIGLTLMTCLLPLTLRAQDVTQMVKDIWPGVGSSEASGKIAANGFFSFNANDSIHGLELWKTDGTEGGTHMVKDIFSGSLGSGVRNCAAVNGTLFFQTSDGIHGYELWESDGTEAGTVLVKDINPGGSPNSSYPEFLTNVNGILFFGAYGGTASTEQLWRSDGTEGGTYMVKQINPTGKAFDQMDPPDFTAVNNLLYFVADDGVHGREVWKSDGTESQGSSPRSMRA